MGTTLRRLTMLCGAGLAAAGVAFGAFLSALPRDVPQHGAADAIVVLTGSEKRVQEGMRLLAQGAGRRLLISGVNRTTTKDELRRMTGLSPLLFNCCVDLGYEARDTVGNAGEAEAWVKTWQFRSLIVVTANYHMPRSLTELRRAVPHATLIAHPVFGKSYSTGTWWHDIGAVRMVVVEFLKTLPAAGRLVLARTLWPNENDTVSGSPSHGNPVSLLSKL